MVTEKRGPSGGGAADSVVGVLILGVYVFCDSFTSQWQDRACTRSARRRARARSASPLSLSLRVPRARGRPRALRPSRAASRARPRLSLLSESLSPTPLSPPTLANPPARRRLPLRARAVQGRSVHDDVRRQPLLAAVPFLSLLWTGEMWASLAFLAADAACARATSRSSPFTSATGQLFIFYTIRRSGRSCSPS